MPAPVCFEPGPRFAAGSGVPRGRSPLGCVPEEGSERSLDELGKRPTSASSAERTSRPFTYSSQHATFVCTNYAFHRSYRLRNCCTRNFGKLICGRVGNPRERGYFSTLWGANSCAACPRRFDLCPVPALPLEAGFQGGAAPLGVPIGKAAKKRFAMGMRNGRLIHVRQSAIRVRLPIPFRARRPYV